MRDINILDVVGNDATAIIEGDKSLHDDIEEVYEFLIKNGKEVLTLTDIYTFPRKLEKLKTHNVQTIIIQTTGLNPKIKELFERFLKLGHSPKNLMVIFKEDLFLNLIYEFKDLDVYKFGEISPDAVEVYMLEYCSSSNKKDENE